MRLRPATADDADVLTELAIRSKGWWGYDEDFLEACRAELTLTPDRIAAETVFVAVDEIGILGFASVSFADDTAELEDLFIDPDRMGLGAGTRLLAHAIATAAATGATTLRIEADPNAESWYRSRGAERVGEAASGSVEGRLLPLLAVALA